MAAEKFIYITGLFHILERNYSLDFSFEGVLGGEEGEEGVGLNGMAYGTEPVDLEWPLPYLFFNLAD